MELKMILRDQRAELKETMNCGKIIKRDAENYFGNLAGSKLIKVTIGVRRAGKSIFTLLTLENKMFGYVNFDDDRLVGVKPNDIYSALLEIYGGKLKIIFFDEIQNLDSWELFVNRLKREGFNVFVTGSNAKLLSRELATHLTGRHLTVELFPFSFREYLRAVGFREDIKTTRGISLVKHELENYIYNSGFPEIVVEGENPGIYLRELYRMIIERDIIVRHGINYKRAFKEVALSIISNPGRQISYNKIKRQFNFGSDHTVKNYISYMEDAYIIFLLDKFSYKPKDVQRSEKKAYAIDTGVVNHAGIQFREDIGHYIENTVAVELFRKRAFNPLIDLFYYKDYQDREVDFVVKEGLSVKQLIQVCYSTNDEATRKREIRALIKASSELRCNNLLIITWDETCEEVVDSKKIVFVPLWKWLLEN